MNKARIVNFCLVQDDQLNSFLSNNVDPSLFEIVGRLRGRKLSEEEACNLVQGATIILVDPSGPELTRRVLEAGQGIEFIQFASVGYDRIDLDAASELGIHVANNPGWAATAVAELTILQILSVLRHLGEHVKNITRFQIAKELKGKTLGILGLGSIGKEVAKLAKGFEPKIIYYKRTRLPESEEKTLGVEYVSFQELLAESDILTIHTPLTDETIGLIGREEIKSMKDGAFLVNTARKEIIDEKAVLDALNEGKLAGLGIDFALETPLTGSENVFVTKHIGAATSEGSTRVREQYIGNLCRVLRGEKPLFLVN